MTDADRVLIVIVVLIIAAGFLVARQQRYNQKLAEIDALRRLTQTIADAQRDQKATKRDDTKPP